MAPPLLRVLFVCTGNICRSPTAHAVFAAMVERAGLGDRIAVDSAGTSGFTDGASPDGLAQRAAAQRGYRMDHLHARSVALADFETFDLILGMTRAHVAELRDECGPAHAHKVRLFMEFTGPSGAQRDVPDPYGGGRDGFERVLDMIEAGARALLVHLRGQ